MLLLPAWICILKWSWTWDTSVDVAGHVIILWILEQNSPTKWSCDPFPVWFFILSNIRIVTRILIKNITINSNVFSSVFWCLSKSLIKFNIFCHLLSSPVISWCLWGISHLGISHSVSNDRTLFPDVHHHTLVVIVHHSLQAPRMRWISWLRSNIVMVLKDTTCLWQPEKRLSC